MLVSQRSPRALLVTLLALLLGCRSTSETPLDARPAGLALTTADEGARPMTAEPAVPPTAQATAPSALVVVSNLLHPPFSSWDGDGRAVGLEVELIAAAARQLARDVEWVERPFAQLLEAVAAGEADIAAATIGITAERANFVAFTQPYHWTTIVALTRLGEGEPESLDQLRRVGTERSTTAVLAAVERIPEAQRVLERTEGRTWAQMLTAGEVDAVVLDRSHVETFMAEAGTRFHRISEPLRVERFALAVHPRATELLSALNQAIATHLTAAGAPQPVSFATSDGGLIHALEYGRGEHGVVLAHGGKFDKESWAEQAQVLVQAGFRVLAIDFRWYGKSRGGDRSKGVYTGLHLDVLAAVEHLRSTGTERVAVVGASMGGWAAAQAAAEPGSTGIDRLVLLGSSGLEEIERITCPKLFITTRDDPRANGAPRLTEVRERYERAREPKELVILDGAAHAQYVFETDQGEQLMQEILRFLSAR